MNKVHRIIFLILILPLFVIGCKSNKEIIPELPKPPEGVRIRQFEDFRLSPGDSLLVPMAKAPFEIIFPVKPYLPGQKDYQAAMIVATNNVALVKQFKSGVLLEEFAPMTPGSGIAAEGLYTTLYVSDYSHHYIGYDPENSLFQRGVKLGEREGRIVLSWKISTVTIFNREYPIRAIPTKGFTLIIMIDENRNGIVEKNEWYMADLRFTE